MKILQLFSLNIPAIIPPFTIWSQLPQPLFIKNKQSALDSLGGKKKELTELASTILIPSDVSHLLNNKNHYHPLPWPSYLTLKKEKKSQLPVKKETNEEQWSRGKKSSSGVFHSRLKNRHRKSIVNSFSSFSYLTSNSDSSYCRVYAFWVSTFPDRYFLQFIIDLVCDFVHAIPK